MLQCTCCGARCVRPALTWQYRGEYFGFPAYEEAGGCPRCGGSLELLSEEADYWEEDEDD